MGITMATTTEMLEELTKRHELAKSQFESAKRELVERDAAIAQLKNLADERSEMIDNAENNCAEANGRVQARDVTIDKLRAELEAVKQTFAADTDARDMAVLRDRNAMLSARIERTKDDYYSASEPELRAQLDRSITNHNQQVQLNCKLQAKVTALEDEMTANRRSCEALRLTLEKVTKGRDLLKQAAKVKLDETAAAPRRKLEILATRVLELRQRNADLEAEVSDLRQACVDLKAGLDSVCKVRDELLEEQKELRGRFTHTCSTRLELREALAVVTKERDEFRDKSTEFGDSAEALHDANGKLREDHAKLTEELNTVKAALQMKTKNCNDCNHRVTELGRHNASYQGTLRSLREANSTLTMDLKTSRELLDTKKNVITCLETVLKQRTDDLDIVTTARDKFSTELGTATALIAELKEELNTVKAALQKEIRNGNDCNHRVTELSRHNASYQDTLHSFRETHGILSTELKTLHKLLHTKNGAIARLEEDLKERTVGTNSGGYMRFWQHIIQVPPDGIRGPVTEKATVEWKRTHNLNPDTRIDYTVWDEVTRCCRVATPHLNTLLREVKNVVQMPTLPIDHLRLATAYHDYLCTQAATKAP